MPAAASRAAEVRERARLHARPRRRARTAARAVVDAEIGDDARRLRRGRRRAWPGARRGWPRQDARPRGGRESWMRSAPRRRRKGACSWRARLFVARAARLESDSDERDKHGGRVVAPARAHAASCSTPGVCPSARARSPPARHGAARRLRRRERRRRAAAPAEPRGERRRAILARTPSGSVGSETVFGGRGLNNNESEVELTYTTATVENSRAASLLIKLDDGVYGVRRVHLAAASRARHDAALRVPGSERSLPRRSAPGLPPRRGGARGGARVLALDAHVMALAPAHRVRVRARGSAWSQSLRRDRATRLGEAARRSTIFSPCLSTMSSSCCSVMSNRSRSNATPSAPKWLMYSSSLFCFRNASYRSPMSSLCRASAQCAPCAAARNRRGRLDRRQERRLFAASSRSSISTSSRSFAPSLANSRQSFASPASRSHTLGRPRHALREFQRRLTFPAAHLLPLARAVLDAAPRQL